MPHAKATERFSGLPPELQPQQFAPAAPYPVWDTDWDHQTPTAAKRARLAGLSGTSASEEECRHALHQLYAEPGPGHKTPAEVDKLIKKYAGDLDKLLLKALCAKRGSTRHLILIRHGQYEDGRSSDEEQVLTPLGRRQAELTGCRVREMLRDALAAPDRGSKHVRIHSSTMTRAKETADIVAAQLSDGTYTRLPPNPLLVEGSPPVHNVPSPFYGARAVHTSLMEVGFRSLVKRLPLASAPMAAENAETPRHEYDIVVCHANVIRFFTMRALQLPPEAWFRVHPNNGSITHLRVNAAGECDLFTFGDAGYMSIDENTFNMTSRYPFK